MVSSHEIYIPKLNYNQPCEFMVKGICVEIQNAEKEMKLT